MTESAAEPLYKLLREIRQPPTLREIMAVCLRYNYVGDQATVESLLPALPAELIDEVSVSEVNVAGLRCVIYSPESESRGLLFYMHGGGFVIGTSEDTDYTTRQLCRSNQLTVVSINYRLAPETVFPGALEDCLQVIDWATRGTKEFEFDASRVFLAGDSAGGNLAAAVALRLFETGTRVHGLILLAPWLDMNVESYESYNRLAPTGVVYDAPFIGYCRSAYAQFQDWSNPLASPFFCDTKHLPPTIIFTGTDDPLLDQSVRFAEQARAHGSDHIELVVYPGMPHCFYSFPSLFAEEVDCYKRIFAFVKRHM